MRFTVEQIFLAMPGRPPADAEPRYHLVEADTVDAALADFLAASSATLVGSIQKFPGSLMATARRDESVFTVSLFPGSDTFHRETDGPKGRR